MTGRQPETGLIEHLTAERESPAWVELFPSLRGHDPESSHTPIGLHIIDTIAPYFEIPDLFECSWGLPELSAVAGAVGTADVYAVSAAAGKDQLALTVEIVAALRRRGKEVLILTPEPIYADNLLPKLNEAKCGEVVRALGAGEPANQLPTASRPFLTDSVTEAGFQAVYLRALSDLQTQRTEAASLRGAVQAAAVVHQCASELEACRARAPAEPVAPVVPNGDERERCRSKREELARLKAELEAASTKKKGLLGGFKALFAKDSTLEVCAETTARIAACESEIRDLIAACERREAERRTAELQYQEETTAWNTHQHEHSALHLQWTAAVTALSGFGFDSGETTLKADSATCETRLAATERLVADLERDRVSIRKQLAAKVGLVVSPCTALGLDASLPPDRVFDHVLVIDAEQQTEADLNRFAARGRHFVLLGDVTTAPRSSWFQSFVRRHADVNWGRDCGKLVARLTAADTTHTGRRITEPLADQPAIHIEFLVTAHGNEPASISFPPQTSPAQAKAFLARELEFIRFRTLGRGTRRDSAAHKQVVFSHVEPFLLHADDWVDLGDGVSESVTPGGWTAVVRFEPHWSDDEIERYLQDRIAAMPRAAILPQPLFIPERKLPKREPAVAAAR